MFNTKDLSVVQFEPGFDYQRTAQSFTVATALLVAGANIGNQEFALDTNFDEVVGIAVYDMSAGTQNYSLAVRDGKGTILQGLTGRKSWVFTGVNTTDIPMPESHHYKMIGTDYKSSGVQKLIFNVANLTAVDLTEDVILDIVVLCRKPKNAGVINN